ncbi:GtrA family protein [Neobacillus citreus]|uniref:GtrA family protein n=1 Tax=Neobacillus citreus TaxID=2833578 RepID=A0A942T319_9BACI|nr:GtrA family protein [Neobacillus citreus]MCH6267617.1 GtrA family protein [Neobacillus citreus]
MKYSFIRFLIVGVINTIVGLTTMYVLLNGLRLSYWWATLLGNIVGAGVSFILNRNFTFKNDAAIGGSLVRFVIVIGICYFVSYSLGLKLAIWFLEKLSLFPKEFAKDLAVLIGTGIYAIMNYLGQKHFVFKSAEKSKTDPNVIT